ncbi:Glycine dehydrogenase (decarboxylating) (glycine cleavage system P protein) [Nostocoides australiense Ben110]|uniref:glycine dehydrogenase (aminomethyl-transferring) n=1 Tax=Nostocoides australiense Ben110 TaxID=1193182 RepID=W6JV69_9MICO|nr:Glycine dehydrogenase (decarboxylating) (glycine cleavage system P protein) [Tetrasphaera australiensis Ben110]
MTTPLPEFAARHIGPRDADIDAMLQAIGQDSLDALASSAIPHTIRMAEALDIEPATSEQAVLDQLRAYADDNRVLTSMIGQGYYGTHTPGVIQRNVLENPAWYTAYTPYQPEISQGRLEALVNFQTMITDLTGLDIAGSSLLDEATAAAEAMTLMHRATRAKADAVLLVDAHVFPQTLAVVRTRAEAIGIPLVVTDLTEMTTGEALRAAAGEKDVFGVLVQYPDAQGAIRSYAALAVAAHEAGALVTAAADLLALTLLKPPGEWGADIAVGSAQRFGVPMMFGGPHAGFMSVRKGLERTMPGRLVGVSVDSAGYPAYRLALQTREQHIRREKATSNICTAQVLLAVMASMYAVYHGPAGLSAIARRVHERAQDIAAGLSAAGIEPLSTHYFDTLTFSVPGRADEFVAAAAEAGINLRRGADDEVGLSVDETTTGDQVARVLGGIVSGMVAGEPTEAALPADLQRTSDFLTHPVFNSYHSETAMLRYLRSLADKDFALDRGMIPLGSCTMKLNATTEMAAITWPEFANLHPFAPHDQSAGYQALIAELEDWLCRITGYDAVSVQPNAGSQGELAGLLAIRAFHRANGQEHRTVCLIPQSAHGTNAASAVMAGMKVVVVATGPGGDIDMVDLKNKIADHGDNLAAIMVTYPSTHGVYEDTIAELCAMIHDAGGQVYVDGANLNALVGLAQPGTFGSDVSHLNLHKTFCIPHGGGGPGVGPIGVRAHLAPFLPASPQQGRTGSAVSAAPYGSAGGGVGLYPAHGRRRPDARHPGRGPERQLHRRPAARALPGALFGQERPRRARVHPRRAPADQGERCHRRRHRQAPHRLRLPRPDDVLPGGRHAHGRADRVGGQGRAGPLLRRDDRDPRRDPAGHRRSGRDRGQRAAACAAHDPVARGGVGPPLRPGPPACFPQGLHATKYWPPVGRIDGAYGDRHLICSCPPPEAFE